MKGKTIESSIGLYVALAFVGGYLTYLVGKFGYVEMAEAVYGTGTAAIVLGYAGALGVVLIFLGGGGALGFGSRVFAALFARREPARKDKFALMICGISVVVGILVLIAYRALVRP